MFGGLDARLTPAVHLHHEPPQHNAATDEFDDAVQTKSKQQCASCYDTSPDGEARLDHHPDHRDYFEADCVAQWRR
jgi:hypothetical protein